MVQVSETLECYEKQKYIVTVRLRADVVYNLKTLEQVDKAYSSTPLEVPFTDQRPPPTHTHYDKSSELQKTAFRTPVTTRPGSSLRGMLWVGVSEIAEPSFEIFPGRGSREIHRPVCGVDEHRVVLRASVVVRELVVLQQLSLLGSLTIVAGENSLVRVLRVQAVFRLLLDLSHDSFCVGIKIWNDSWLESWLDWLGHTLTTSYLECFRLLKSDSSHDPDSPQYKHTKWLDRIAKVLRSPTLNWLCWDEYFYF